jgi:hypothetical protein
MEKYYYYKALRKSTIMFLDMFNGIKIARYNRGGIFEKYVGVPLKYGPKEKWWYWMHERKDDEMLPIMSVTMQGIEYSLERTTNKFKNILTTCGATNASTIQRYLNPAPYDIQYQLSIWALYMTDIDQILESILPYFQPHAYIRLPIEELNSTYDLKVIFNSLAPDMDLEWADENFRILRYTLDFTVQSYLFKPVETAGVIGKIFTNFYLSEGAFAQSGNTTTTFTSGASGESQYFLGISPTAGDPLYDYELYNMGDKVGKTLHLGEF